MQINIRERYKEQTHYLHEIKHFALSFMIVFKENCVKKNLNEMSKTNNKMSIEHLKAKMYCLNTEMNKSRYVNIKMHFRQ